MKNLRQPQAITAWTIISSYFYSIKKPGQKTWLYWGWRESNSRLLFSSKITHRINIKFCLLILIFFFGSCSTQNSCEKMAGRLDKENPFSHDLSIQCSPGTNQTILLCSHGFGGSSQSVMDRVRPNTSDTVISFNYIDHDFSHETGDDTKTVVATPLEVMPLLYMLKKCVVDNKLSSISLYGYALGAANIIYAIERLTTENFDDLLKKYSITTSDKETMLNAIRRGKILLDVPFKSIDEVIALRESNSTTALMYKERAAKYGISSPLKTLSKLKNLGMTFLLFFTTNNEEFSNRYDADFAKNLLDANANGTNIVITADNGGHSDMHTMLWKIYSNSEK